MVEHFKEWFTFLNDLMKDEPELQEKVLSAGRVRITVEKAKEVGERIFIIKIFEGENKKPREVYVIGEEGMYEMFFEYPSLVHIPAAPIDFPAYMTREQREEWNFTRAQCVADFIKEKINIGESKEE